MAPLKASQRQLQAFHSQDYIHFLETHSNQSDSEKEDDETAEEMEEHGLGVYVTSVYDTTSDLSTSCAPGNEYLVARSFPPQVTTVHCLLVAMTMLVRWEELG